MSVVKTKLTTYITFSFMVKDSAYLVSTCQKSVKYFIYFYFFFLLFCLFPFIGVGWKVEYSYCWNVAKYKNIDQMVIASAVKSQYRRPFFTIIDLPNLCLGFSCIQKRLINNMFFRKSWWDKYQYLYNLLYFFWKVKIWRFLRYCCIKIKYYRIELLWVFFLILQVNEKIIFFWHIYI